jgi:hypothetical protein
MQQFYQWRGVSMTGSTRWKPFHAHKSPVSSLISAGGIGNAGGALAF